MVRKRNPNARTSRPALSSTANGSTLAEEPQLVSPADLAAVKAECERALTAFRRGNHTKALRLMKEACQHYDSSALLHRVHSTIFFKVASILDDPSTKLRHMRSAIDSARRAVTLSPNSIEFAHFYANLLFEAASDSSAYEEVAQVCERALAIVDPVDPAKESLQEESQQKLTSSEARITHVEQELRSLLQKSNIASLSTWVKCVGNGSGRDENIRLIPMRRITEDPMEVRLVQVRRPNEIKKATKTPEERRKEIEVRVAAAMVLQHKSNSSAVSEDDMRSSEPPSSSGSRDRRRLNSSRKLSSSAERIQQVRSHWNSMSIDERTGFLSVNVADLKQHLALSFKDKLASDILSEALDFFGSHRSWKYRVCCRCDQKFADCDDHVQHILREHVGCLSPKLQSVLPQEVDRDWIEMLVNWCWKPIDSAAVVNMLEDEVDSEHVAVRDEGSNAGSIKDKECPSDCWILNDNLDSSKHPQLGESQENACAVANKKKEISTSLKDASQRWPLSEDSERAKLLERIQGMFQLFIKHKNLSVSHLNKVIQLAIEEIQSLPSGSLLLNHALNQSPISICLLGSQQLRKVLKFLQELSHSCGLARYLDKDNTSGDTDQADQSCSVVCGITLASDSASLHLDSHLFHAKNGSGCSVVSSVDNGICGTHDADAVVSWLFSGPSIGEELSAWTQSKEEKSQQCVDTILMLEKEVYLLQTLCERKCDHCSYEEALLEVENICLEEYRKRDPSMKFAPQSYEVLLRRRQEELSERKNDAIHIGKRFELDAISNVLKEARGLGMSQFGYSESLSGVTSHFCELECANDDDWRMHDMQQVDTCIELAIQRQREQLSFELCKIDSKILRNVNDMQQLEHKLGNASSFDYQTITIPLVKCFLRKHLESLVDKAATEKSDAAREAFLAELALNEKKNVNMFIDSKQTHEKSKDKKKGKDSRKAKDTESAGSKEHLHETTINCELTASNVDDPVISEALKTKNHVTEDEELFRKELEEEERKLEETLEYQRRVEDEAKQKHLAEQHRNAVVNGGKTFQESCAVVSHLNADSVVQKVASTYNGQTLLHDNADAVCLKGIQFGDFYAGVTTKYRQNVQHEKPPIPCGEGNKLTSPQAQWCVSDYSSCPETGLVEMRTFDRSVSRANNSWGVKVNGVERPASIGISSKHANAQKTKKTNNQSHSRLYQVNDEMKPFKPVHVEDDDERFQEDLKRAVLQSLDSFQAERKLPLAPVIRSPQLRSSESDTTNQELSITVNSLDVYGTGLKNAVGEYNCFLNVIIQSLWHLRRFRDEFLMTSSLHAHIGNPCVVCALLDIFLDLSRASLDGQREPVAPSCLRIALHNLYPDSNFFQEDEMNDASEVLEVIFDCLHKSFTSYAQTESEDANSIGTWDCASNKCIVHSLFGMDIFEQMNCSSCGLESRRLKYTSFFHNINANALRTMKITSVGRSFDELLRNVEMNHQLPCDKEAGGCGKLNSIYHILSAPPHVFTAVLGWQNTNESLDDISATLKAITNDVDIGVLYSGVDLGRKHSLVSVCMVTCGGNYSTSMSSTFIAICHFSRDFMVGMLQGLSLF
ncbi:hypothetical protein AXF42_Ash014259 [Apostasia shenzhenica]|uniref:USP domain-containing protein n=1 Tax=Apostasia shenzhenica TaxID=1088818 RepID=A0A2I0A1E1_9ASPA|nr:hypothetical protein AXF42_Ash014259 [Apostasia shenzhenica]